MCCQFREDLLVSVNIIFWLFLLVDPTSGISWGSNDEIVFGQGAKGIMRVSAKGGKPQNVVTVQNDELADRPQILPGGKTLLFTLAKGTIVNNRRWDAAQIVAQVLATSERTVLISGGSDGRYVPTGHLVYALGGTLQAAPFNLQKLQVTGDPVPILEGVMRSVNNQTGVAQFSLSENGSLIYVPGPSSTAAVQQSLTLTFFDRNGGMKKLGIPAGPYLFPRISPDGETTHL